MTPDAWAMLWVGAINLLWGLIFVGVLIFALRTDTETGHGDDRRPGTDPPPDRPPDHRGPGRFTPRATRRLRGAERIAARRRRTGTTYHPRPLR